MKDLQAGMWYGLDIEFRIENDWEGDPSVPGGTRVFRSVSEFGVFAPDGTDITDLLNDKACDDLQDYILQEY